MPDPSEFQQLAAMGPAGSGDGTEPSYDPRFGQELQRAMAQTPQMQEFRQLGAQFKVNADLMKLPQPAEEMSMRTDPKTGQKTVTVKTTAQNYENTMEAATNYHQVLAGFLQQSQKAEMRLRMQEEQARNQSPWIQLATALAANMAQAKDLPGWVQAAGRTSAQLNPRPEEIGARRLAVMQQGAGMAEKALALGEMVRRTGIEEKQFGLAQEKEARLAKENQIKDLLKVESDASLSARKDGIFDKDLYVRQRLAMGDKPETANASAERLDSVAAMARKRNEEVANAKDSKEADKIKMFYDGLAAQADRTAKMIEAADRRAAEAATRGDAAKQAKAEEPSPVLKKQLGDLNSADTALDEIEKLITDPKNAALMGPLAGRMASGAAAVGVDAGGRIAGLKQKLMQQTAQAIKATGAGARGFGPQERPYFEQMAEGINRTPEQNLKILQGWREYLDQERKGAMIANPDVKWEGKYAPALGKRLGGGGAKTGKTSSGVSYEIIPEK